MIGKVQVVTDSASYLPESVRAQFGVIVVPMRVSLDGDDYREFVDLDAGTFYQRLAAGAVVRTSQPSPGEFGDVYEHAAAAGASQVLSIHIGAALSGTLNSARIAADAARLPVRLVDTAQASFIEGLAVWAACDSLSAGGSLEEAEEAALRTAQNTGNVFIVQGTRLLERGGRLDPRSVASGPTAVPVLALVDGSVRAIGQADSRAEALSALVDHLVANALPGARLRIGIGNGGAGELADELQRLVAASSVASFIDVLVQYQIGPSIGAHTGAGCTGIVFESRPAGP